MLGRRKNTVTKFTISNPNGFQHAGGSNVNSNGSAQQVQPITMDELVTTLVTNPNKQAREQALERFLATDNSQNPSAVSPPQYMTQWKMGLSAQGGESNRVEVMVKQFVQNRTNNQAFAFNPRQFDTLVKAFPCLMGTLSFKGEDNVEHTMLAILKQTLPMTLPCKELDKGLWTNALYADVSNFFTVRQEIAELLKNGLDLNSPEVLNNGVLQQLEKTLALRFAECHPFYEAELWNEQIQPKLEQALGEGYVEKKAEKGVEAPVKQHHLPSIKGAVKGVAKGTLRHIRKNKAETPESELEVSAPIIAEDKPLPKQRKGQETMIMEDLGVMYLQNNQQKTLPVLSSEKPLPKLPPKNNPAAEENAFLDGIQNGTVIAPTKTLPTPPKQEQVPIVPEKKKPTIPPKNNVGNLPPKPKKAPPVPQKEVRLDGQQDTWQRRLSQEDNQKVDVSTSKQQFEKQKDRGHVERVVTRRALPTLPGQRQGIEFSGK